MSYVWERATLMGHLSMNQTAEGLTPAPKGGHNRDVWEERVMAQYIDPLHRLAVECDIDLIRSYDERITRIEQTLETLAKKNSGRDYTVIRSVPGIGRILTLSILFEIDTITHFPSVKNFSSYSRLVKGSMENKRKFHPNQEPTEQSLHLILSFPCHPPGAPIRAWSDHSTGFRL
jgi:transposase